MKDFEKFEDWTNYLKIIFENKDKPCKCIRINNENETIYYTCKSCVAKLFYDNIEKTMKGFDIIFFERE